MINAINIKDLKEEDDFTGIVFNTFTNKKEEILITGITEGYTKFLKFRNLKTEKDIKSWCIKSDFIAFVERGDWLIVGKRVVVKNEKNI